MPVNFDDYELVEEDYEEVPEYPRTLTSSAQLPESVRNWEQQRQVGRGMENTQDFTTALAGSTGLFTTPEDAQRQAAERNRILSAGGEEIPASLKAATAIHSGLKKAAYLPWKVGESLNDITGLSRFLDVIGLPGPEGGYQSNTEKALAYISDQEQRMTTSDEAVHGQDIPYQLLEGFTRGVAELPAQMGPAMLARNAAQGLKIASGTAGFLGGVGQFAQDRGQGRSTLEALPRAVLSGLITGMTTKAFGATGAEAILKGANRLVGLKAKLKDMLFQAGFEIPEEMLDQAGQDILERFDNNPDKPFAATVKDVLMAGAIGGLIGGAASGARNLLPGPARKSEVDRPQDLSGIRLNQGGTANSKAAEEFHQLQQMEREGKLDMESAQRLEELKTISKSGMTIEDLDYLEQERQGMRLESTITTGSNPDDPFTGRVMQANFRTGKVEINPYEMAVQMKGMKPEERKAYIKSALSEEQIHLATPQETADAFIKNATGVEKFLAGWRYTGNISGKPQAGEEISERNLGHEMLRSQIQRMQGITRTELAASVKSGKLTTKILLATEDAIFDIRKALGTNASKEQLAALDQVQKNVKEGLRIASGAEGDDKGPASVLRPGATAAEDLMKMPTEEANAFFDEIRAAGNATQNDAVLQGMKLSEQDVPRLQELSKQVRDETMKAVQSNDGAAYKAAFGKMVWLNGAIEGAKREGPNYKAVVERQAKEAAPATLRRHVEASKKEDFWTGSGYALAIKDARSELGGLQNRLNSIVRDGELWKSSQVIDDAKEIYDQVGEIIKSSGVPYKHGFPSIDKAPPEKRIALNKLFMLSQDAAMIMTEATEGSGEAPATMRRGGPSKRGQEIAEQRRRILEAQAKAKGEELPPELQSKSGPATGSAAEPISEAEKTAIADKIGSTWGFIIPTPAQISQNANEVLGGNIKPTFKAKSEKRLASDIARSEKADSKLPVQAGSTSYDRPSFQKFVDSFTGKGQVAITPSKLREAWEDSVWSNVLNAPAERLESLRKALGLEKNYGSSKVAEVTAPAPEVDRPKYRGEKSAEEAGVAANDWRRSAATRMTEAVKRAEARRRYRMTLTRAIAMKLIGEANEGRTSLDRPTVSVDDIAFDSEKTQHGPYTEIRRADLADPKRLKAILRDQARGSSSDPETASRRLMAVVDDAGKVHLVSTYNDAGVQRAVSPLGTGMRHRPHEAVDAAFLKRYRPFASILLTDPIKGFKQTFKSVSEFNDQIGREAAGRAKIGDWEIVPEGPAAEDFQAEGTPGLEGEGGSFMGPGKQAFVPGARAGAMESDAPLTYDEADGVLNHVMDEAGSFNSPEDVKLSLDGLVAAAADDRLTPADRMAINGYRKVFDAIEAANPNLSREEVIDRMADAIYENYQTSETAAEFVRKSLAEFAPQSARPAGPTGEAKAVGPSGVVINPDPGVTPSLKRDKPTTRWEGTQLQEYKRQQDISAQRQKIYRKQGVLPTYEQAQQIYDENFPEQGAMPASLRMRRGEAQSSLEYLSKYLSSKFNMFMGVDVSSKGNVLNLVREVIEPENGEEWLNPKSIAEFHKVIGSDPKAKSAFDSLKKSLSEMRAEEARGLDLGSTDRSGPQDSFPASLRMRRTGTIPAPEEILPDTTSPIPRFISNANTALTKAMGIERIPLIGGLWGARGKIKDDVDREIVGYSVKRNIGNAQAAVIGARMAALNEELGVPFKQDKDGKILNLKTSPGQSQFPSDVFEAWQQQEIVPEKMSASRKFSEDEIAEYSEKHPRTITLTKEQDRLFREMLKVIEDGYKYLDEKNAKLDTYNGESRESRERQQLMVGLPKGIEWHAFPRIALYKRSTGPLKTEIRRRIGGSYGVEQERLYKTEFQGQQTTAYEPDMTKRMVAFTQRIYKAVADADMANSATLKGEKPEQRVGKLAKEYEAELRSGEMTQRDILDLSKKSRLGIEGEISSHPAFSGKIYPIEIAQKLDKAFGEQSHKWVRAASELSTATKAFMLTGDLAQYLQQGGPMMLRHPGMWANATVKSLRSLADPAVTGKYLRNQDNYRAATEFIQSGGSLGHLQDFMSGSQPGELATRVPGFRQVVIRSGRAFGTFFDIAKIEMWKGLRESTPKSEWPQVVETIENTVLSGRMESAGMNHARATGERIMLMASAYYRGAIGLVAGMAEKGVAGSEARKTLASYAGGLTLLMVASYLAAGMSWEEIRKRLMPGLNNPKFLSYPVKIGGETVEVGPGGIVLNLASLGVDVGITLKDDPKALVSFGMKNPLIKWLTTKLGPIPGLGRKIATGEDVFGNPVKPVAAVAEMFQPIPVQKAIKLAGSSNKGAALVSGGASFVGLAASKYKASNEVYELAQKFIDEEGLRKSTGWKQVQTDDASYTKLRSAVASGSQKRFNEMYEKLAETHTDAEIRSAMEQWVDRPFTGSDKNEKLFIGSLNDHEFDLYLKAKEERMDAYANFMDMISEVP